jgi:hypothetical protein
VGATSCHCYILLLPPTAAESSVHNDGVARSVHQSCAREFFVESFECGRSAS